MALGVFLKGLKQGEELGEDALTPSAPFPLHKRQRRLKKGRKTTINFPRARGDESLAGIIMGEGALSGRVPLPCLQRC